MKITAFKGNFGSLEYYVAMLDAAELAPVFNPFYQSAEQAIKDGTDNAYSRAQRLLDMPHVRKIVKYLSRSIRFFSSPSAACSVKATPIDITKKLYEIEVEDAYLFDGQKRVKACILKHQEDASFNDQVSVLFVNTDNLHVRQQLFTDNNDTAAKVSRSLSFIYDHVNPLSKFIPAIVPERFLEVEKGTIGKSSTKLVTPKIMQEAVAILFNTSEASWLKSTAISSVAVGIHTIRTSTNCFPCTNSCAMSCPSRFCANKASYHTTSHFLRW